MKMKHLEIARTILLSGALISSIKVTGDAQIIQDITEFFNEYHINRENINDIFNLGFNLSLLIGCDLEQLTYDYELLESMYSYIINNTAELIEHFGIQDDPIKVFAFFVYLYRNGYLSHQHEFYYSTNMKDLACLNGIDVVRGTGVCRSIASMFTDICNAVNLTASNVSVRATSKGLAKKEKLCPTELQEKDNGKKFAKIVGKVTSILPIGNHLVTLVEKDGSGLVLDPTNDVFMQLRTGCTYEFANDTSATMSYSFISNIAPKVLGQMNTQCNFVKLRRLSTKDTISYEEYYKTYKATIAMIEEHKDILDRFYDLNREFYERLTIAANEQQCLVKRMFPLLPIKKK